MPPPPPPPLPARGASDTDRKAAGAMSASLQAVADIGGLAAGHLGRRAREMVRTEAWLPRVEGMARGGGLAGSPTVRALRDLGLLAVSRVQSRLGGLARPDVLAERAREIVVGTLTGTGAGRPMQSRTLQDLGSALSSRLGGSFPLGGLGDRVQIGVILAHLSGPGVLLFKLLQDPRVPARHKILLAAAAGYVVLPGDILPDLVPGLGMVDDVLVIAVALDVMLNHTDDEIVRSHWDGDEVSLAAVRRAVGTAAVLVPARTRRLLLGDSVSTGADLRRFLPRRLARLVPA